MIVLIIGLLALIVCVAGVIMGSVEIVLISGFVGAFVIIAGMIQLGRDWDEW